jgi:DNA end-binding protein Ku
MPRSIWKGVITFGMVSIPVRLFPATEDKDIRFHLLHEKDHSRIRFKRFCSKEEEEVPSEEIARAFEVTKDQYVEISDEDLDKLPLPSKHTIELSAFVKAGEIDPIYYEKSYYLEPEETGLKPFALLAKTLVAKKVAGVAKIALRNKEQLCALRTLDGTIVLETLHYPDEIREHEQHLPKVSVSEREIDIASSLVEALSEEFAPSKYKDHYREALVELITNKTEGREVVAPEEAGVAPVTDLMAALRASVEAARKRKPGGEPTEAARKVRETAAAGVAKHNPDKRNPAAKHTAHGRKPARSTKTTKRASRSKSAA